MKKRFLRTSAYLLASLAIIFAVSFANAGDSTSFNPTAVTVQVDSIGGVPIGSIIPWPSSTPPKDYLECNGQSFSAATYPKLKVALNGATTVPDYQDEFLRGASASRAVGSKQVDAIRNITGSFYAGEFNSLDGDPNAFTVMKGKGAFSSGGVTSIHGWGSQSGFHSDHTYRIDFKASDQVPTANENRPRNVAVMYIIRAK
ncbi:phage tail protein [Halodesulfovibrio marinisediminis]|uniref:Phage Tail Collar Domain n=1 Tax=Halodesulfovibrio marinisediminis DSM 17456 TaxID=1121457 RepID=A0A1N6FE50_9BACT|nr:phage tail protein [Halodesulfovibrio marinisediminis]SIN93529.1 Phage Tail Collar Domain [Halodesulfovibrio marinisediminis DSM 17456]